MRRSGLATGRRPVAAATATPPAADPHLDPAAPRGTDGEPRENPFAWHPSLRSRNHVAGTTCVRHGACGPRRRSPAHRRTLGGPRGRTSGAAQIRPPPRTRLEARPFAASARDPPRHGAGEGSSEAIRTPVSVLSSAAAASNGATGGRCRRTASRTARRPRRSGGRPARHVRGGPRGIGGRSPLAPQGSTAARSTPGRRSTRRTAGGSRFAVFSLEPGRDSPAGAFTVLRSPAPALGSSSRPSGSAGLDQPSARSRASRGKAPRVRSAGTVARRPPRRDALRQGAAAGALAGREGALWLPTGKGDGCRRAGVPSSSRSTSPSGSCSAGGDRGGGTHVRSFRAGSVGRGSVFGPIRVTRRDVASLLSHPVGPSQPVRASSSRSRGRPALATTAGRARGGRAAFAVS